MEELHKLESERPEVYNSTVSVDLDEGTLAIEATLEAGDTYPIVDILLSIIQRAEGVEAGFENPALLGDWSGRKLHLAHA